MPTDDCRNHHLLGEYGPYATVAQAKATLELALSKLLGEGGGVLCIPRDAPAGFYPRNPGQTASGGPGVTIEDYRQGFERTYVPPIGTLDSAAGSVGCQIVERDLAQDLPWQGVYSTQATSSRYLGGASSYFAQLTQDAAAGTDKLHVQTHRGLFAGQTLLVTGVAGGYDLPHDTIKVKSLGLDAQGPYVVAGAPLANAHPALAFVYNKNVVNGFTLDDVSNCDNQSMSLIVNRTIYGTGDTFGISSRLGYQGNIMSGLGDEGGVGVASQIEHDLHCFWGEVESWKPATGELVYKPVIGAPQKLGTSRPLINMNPAKWIRSGKIMIIAPGYGYLRGAPSSATLVIGTSDVGWDKSVVGRFIAVDEPTERYDSGEAAPVGGALGKPVHRWWHITGIETRPDRRTNLYVESTFWYTDLKSGPQPLFRFDNYTTSASHIRELSYIIAPGAWISDVRHAVAGNTPGNGGSATAEDERRLLLAPSPSAGTRFDFAVGDPVTNPPGPHVWAPTAFRARHFDGFPGAIAGTSFLSENWGRVQMGSALFVAGTARTLADTAGQKDGEPSFDAGIYLFSCMNTALRVRGDVKNEAIDFWQVSGPHLIRWRHAAGSSTLHADPADGSFRFAGGDLNYQGRGAVQVQGISGTPTPAHNLRGVNVPVAAGLKEIAVSFPSPEADAVYGLLVDCNWITAKAVKNKTAAGFKVVFDKAVPAGGGTLDWLLVR